MAKSKAGSVKGDGVKKMGSCNGASVPHRIGEKAKAQRKPGEAGVVASRPMK